MNPPSHDLYDVGTKLGRDESRAGQRSGKGRVNTLWLDAHRRLRRQTYLFAFVVLFATFLIFALLTYHVLSLRRLSRARMHSFGLSIEPRVSPLMFDLDPKSLFLFEELWPPPPPEANAGPLPLTASSVKQAAYYVVKAENAVRQERLEEALQAYRQTLRLFPGIKGVQSQIGVLLLRQKDYAGAAAAFEAAIREEPTSFTLANNLGVSQLGLENYDAAEASLLLAIRLNPSYAMAYFNLATLYLRRGNLEKASSLFEQYRALKPDDLTAAQTHALILLQLGDWKRAAELLQQITRASPGIAPVHFRLAQALSHTENRSAAIEALQRAVSLVDPRHALVWMSRSEFNALRSEPGFQELAKKLSARE